VQRRTAGAGGLRLPAFTMRMCVIRTCRQVRLGCTPAQYSVLIKTYTIFVHARLQQQTTSWPLSGFSTLDQPTTVLGCFVPRHRPPSTWTRLDSLRRVIRSATPPRRCTQRTRPAHASHGALHMVPRHLALSHYLIQELQCFSDVPSGRHALIRPRPRSKPAHGTSRCYTHPSA